MLKSVHIFLITFLDLGRLLIMKKMWHIRPRIIIILPDCRETQCSKVHKYKSASEVLEWGSYCDQNPQWRQQVKLHFRIKVYLVLKKTKPVYHLFFACCSALCGLLADSEGGTMFRWEANTCTVATYTGLPENYQDGKASLASLYRHRTSVHECSCFIGTPRVSVH